MPPPALLDLAGLDLNQVAATREEIYARLPHRFEFMQLDAIVKVDPQRHELVALRHVREDEWWCKGHLPGRPLFPGVLMIESAAHLASYYYYLCLGTERFLGFGGVEGFKFREAVRPPARLVLVGRAVEIKPRRLICDVQGFVGDAMAFEGRIFGMPV